MLRLKGKICYSLERRGDSLQEIYSKSTKARSQAISKKDQTPEKSETDEEIPLHLSERRLLNRCGRDVETMTPTLACYLNIRRTCPKLSTHLRKVDSLMKTIADDPRKADLFLTSRRCS